MGFFKKLADSTGHVFDACQGVLEVAAQTRRKAIHQACEKFAGDRQVRSWSLRADRVTAALIRNSIEDSVKKKRKHDVS